jgi:hypothetical protein
MLKLPNRSSTPLRALYDSGAELNLINLNTAKALQLDSVLHHRKPTAGFLDEHSLKLHSAHELIISCTDRHGVKKDVGPENFWAANFEGYDLVLGYPWLAAADPKIKFSEGWFEWWSADSSRVELTDTKDLLRDVGPGERVYVLIPGSHRIRPVADEQQSKDLLQYCDTSGDVEPDRRQAMGSAPSGDEALSAEYMHGKGLLWLQSYIQDIREHLLRCVEDLPSLDWLPEATVHRVVASMYQAPPQRARTHPGSSRRLPDGSPEHLDFEDAPEPEDLTQVPEHLRDLGHCFSSRGAGIIPPNTEHDHAIDLEEGKMPPNLPIYNLSRRELEILREYLDSATEKGWIRPSKSPVGAPILFVPKADGTMRLCVDYRGLNKVTIKNRYPIPLVSEMLDRFSKASIFTKLDLRDAYHRLRIKEGDEWKTAFKTRYGHFEYLVMPFGLANAPASFQSYIHRALGGLVDRTCVVYLDDILIYSNSEDDHEEHVREVLERLYDWGLYCKSSKCTFSTKSVEFLGYIVTPEGVVMDPERVKTIQEWPEPEGYRDIQVFLGFANFYRRFIHNYSAIVRPLTEHMTDAQSPPTGQGESATKPKKKKATRKGPTKWYKPWSWPAEVREAFLDLRRRFTEAPVLQHFDPVKPLMVLTDASEFAAAAIILQPQDAPATTEKHWKPVAFWSRKFSGPQLRWHTHDKELSAIVESFKHWRHYLEHAPSTIRVLSDHNNLRYFMTTKELSPKQARWAEELARFDFEIEYKPGTENPADAPSRRPDYAKGLVLGEGKAVRDAMLPTLQTKLRVWALRKLIAPRAGSRTACDSRQPVGGPTGTQQRPGVDAKQDDKEFPSTALENDDTSSSDSQAESMGESRWENDLGAGTDRDVASLFLERPVLYPTCSPTHLAVGAVQEETAFALEVPERLAEYIRDVQEADVAYQQNVALAEKCMAGNAKKGDPGWETDPRGVLRRAGKVWIPSDMALRQAIMRKNHDDPLGGHYGVHKTVELLQRKYHWPKLRANVKDYIHHCPTCQLNKTRRHKPWGWLEPLPPPTTPWRHYSLDFVTDLPESKDARGNVYDSILVLIDRFSKYTRYLPVNKTITSRRLADILREQCFLKMGPPDTLLSDRGSVFTSQFWSDICYHLNVDHRLSTAFHPQTDGQTERQNQELESFLRMYLNYQQDNWCELLPYAEYAYNSKTHASHGQCPIQVAYGMKPKGFDGVDDEHWLRPPPHTWDASGKTPALREQVVAYLKQWSEQWDVANQSLKQAQVHQAHWYNSKRNQKHFGVGDMVILRSKNIKTKRPSKKFDAKYLGPFAVAKKIGKLAYKLSLPHSMAKIHPVFHVSLLEDWNEPPPEQGFRPGPIQHPEIAGDRYEVEGILEHRGPPEKRQYRIKWLGWPVEDSTWEPESNLDNCEETLREYWLHPIVATRKPRRGAIDLQGDASNMKESVASGSIDPGTGNSREVRRRGRPPKKSDA